MNRSKCHYSLLDYSNTCWIGSCLFFFTYKRPPATWERDRGDESEIAREYKKINGWKSRGRKSPCLSFDMYISIRLLKPRFLFSFHQVPFAVTGNSFYCFSVFFPTILLHTMYSQSGWCFDIDSHLHVVVLLLLALHILNHPKVFTVIPDCQLFSILSYNSSVYEPILSM